MMPSQREHFQRVLRVIEAEGGLVIDNAVRNARPYLASDPERHDPNRVAAYLQACEALEHPPLVSDKYVWLPEDN